MKKILIVNAERDWIDRCNVLSNDTITAIDEQGREHEVKYTVKGWAIIRDTKVVFQSGHHKFLDFFDNKPKEFKVYLHR